MRWSPRYSVYTPKIANITNARLFRSPSGVLLFSRYSTIIPRTMKKDVEKYAYLTIFLSALQVHKTDPEEATGKVTLWLAKKEKPVLLHL